MIRKILKLLKLGPLGWCALAGLGAMTLALAGCADMDSFLFNTEPIDHYSPPASIPDSLLESVSFMSESNKLYGFWVRSSGQRSGLTILYFHGNKHHLDEYWDRVEFLRQLGTNVMIFDYRGFGMSEGVSSEHGMYADAEAALAFVRARGVPDDSLVLYGYSLGNVGSFHLAADVVRPRALIAESAFASSTSLVQGATVLDIPQRWMTEGTFDNAEAAGRVTAPVLMLHGEEDDFVRYRDNAPRIFERITATKRLVAVPGANHADVPQTMGIPAYLEVLREWIR